MLIITNRSEGVRGYLKKLYFNTPKLAKNNKKIPEIFFGKSSYGGSIKLQQEEKNYALNIDNFLWAFWCPLPISINIVESYSVKWTVKTRASLSYSYKY